MKPPPPMLPASGQETASAKAVATAASTAFPPSAKTFAPIRLATAESLTTIPPSPRSTSIRDVRPPPSFIPWSSDTDSRFLLAPVWANAWETTMASGKINSHRSMVVVQNTKRRKHLFKDTWLSVLSRWLKSDVGKINRALPNQIIGRSRRKCSSLWLA